MAVWSLHSSSALLVLLAVDLLIIVIAKVKRPPTRFKHQGLQNVDPLLFVIKIGSILNFKHIAKIQPSNDLFLENFGSILLVIICFS